jgi:acyl carrier protein
MNNADFLNNMLEVFDNQVENLTLDCDFRAFDAWDSLASVSAVAMIYAEYDVQVSGDELRSCNTIGELMNLVQEKQAAS